ncbi:alpha/beta fold hydrolase [Streptomyces sp. NPDC004609]|uniref:alpha/beta fold hydrolase n=1 Tax=Streptomyces sp. NPDC004609 TaxID=3364704 RepID=UPI0036BED468
MSHGTDFDAAYDAALSRWPVEVESVDVPSRFGSTRVHISGPEHGARLVLLPGGGTTSMVWFANVAELARDHRVYAVDVMGDIGRSVHNGAPLRGIGDLTAWMDDVFDGLDLDGAHLCGHSYGAWITLNYALHAPGRVGRIVLLDPTNCFAGMSVRYFLRALPALLKPSVARHRSFLRWETGRASGDPAWQSFLDSTVTAPRSKILVMRRPKTEALRSCTVPTLVLLAERSRAHHPLRTAAAARRRMPRAEIAMLPDASHHTIPTEDPALLNGRLTEFLA